MRGGGSEDMEQLELVALQGYKVSLFFGQRNTEAIQILKLESTFGTQDTITFSRLCLEEQPHPFTGFPAKGLVSNTANTCKV